MCIDPRAPLQLTVACAPTAALIICSMRVVLWSRRWRRICHYYLVPLWTQGQQGTCFCRLSRQCEGFIRGAGGRKRKAWSRPSAPRGLLMLLPGGESVCRNPVLPRTYSGIKTTKKHLRGDRLSPLELGVGPHGRHARLAHAAQLVRKCFQERPHPPDHVLLRVLVQLLANGCPESWPFKRYPFTAKIYIVPRRREPSRPH